MSREAFEVWFSDQGQFPMACEKGRGGFYLLQHANTSWIAWQAATAAALEEAAEIADAHATCEGIAQRIAAEIRALKDHSND